MRGMVVGFVMGLAIFFIFGYKIHNFIIVILYSFFGSITLGVLGIIAGILTEKFDQLAAFQNFIIMPMTFLAGVFYSVESLPNPWKTVSQFNPFYYIVDGFRYGFIGHSDFNPYTGLSLLILFFLICSTVTIFFLKSGYKLRN